jgi:hypothetical protein
VSAKAREPRLVGTGTILFEGQDATPSVGFDFEPSGDPVLVGQVSVEFFFGSECPAFDLDDLGRVVSGPHPTGGYESGSHYVDHGRRRCDCDTRLVPVAVVK